MTTLHVVPSGARRHWRRWGGPFLLSVVVPRGLYPTPGKHPRGKTRQLSYVEFLSGSRTKLCLLCLPRIGRKELPCWPWNERGWVWGSQAHQQLPVGSPQLWIHCPLLHAFPGPQTGWATSWSPGSTPVVLCFYLPLPCLLSCSTKIRSRHANGPLLLQSKQATSTPSGFSPQPFIQLMTVRVTHLGRVGWVVILVSPGLPPEPADSSSPSGGCASPVGLAVSWVMGEAGTLTWWWSLHKMVNRPSPGIKFSSEEKEGTSLYNSPFCLLSQDEHPTYHRFQHFSSSELFSPTPLLAFAANEETAWEGKDLVQSNTGVLRVPTDLP